MKTNLALALTLLLAMTGTAAAKITKKELKKVLKENPDVLLEVLEENSSELLKILNKAAQKEQLRQKTARADAEKKAFEDSFKNPLKPAVSSRARIRGRRKAKYTLVEYSDFQCPYCEKGFRTVEQLREKYGRDIRFLFKHKPLDFHPEAMPAALHMEAISLQSQEKAWQFHDELFKNQSKLGADFYTATAKKLGVNMKKLAADVKSEKVARLVKKDMAEAEKFGFTGTPGFLLNGIPIRGAYPLSHFVTIIERLDKNR